MKLYVEGGGDSRELHTRCREAFRSLLGRAGFQGRMPRIVACGSRNDAFDDFNNAHRKRETAMLLVDSEGPVVGKAWEHLKVRDGWERPAGASDDQAQLMVQCMETWLVADPKALEDFFGSKFRVSVLPPQNNFESRATKDIQKSLEHATKSCGRVCAYRKGRRSFEVLARLNPTLLKQRLPHFKQFCVALEKVIP